MFEASSRPDGGMTSKVEGAATTQRVAVEKQIWFGVDEAPLFGWVASPSDGLVQGGVVLCPPLARDVFSTHRVLRKLAVELANAGFVALRFDYPATGDSAGQVEDPDLVRRWLTSVHDARVTLRDLGAPSVAVVGIRMGALLAAFAAQCEPGAFESLVLWDPCASSRAFLREQSLLLSGYAPGEHDPRYWHTPGFHFSSETGDDLQAIDFAKLAVDGPLADRILLLQRDDVPQASSIRKRLEHEGDRLTVDAAYGQAGVLDVEVHEIVVPQRTMDRIVGWLAKEPAPVVAALAELPERHSAEIAARPGVYVRETSMAVGQRGIRGILTEPVDNASAEQVTSRPRPWVVLMNTATEHHIGPGRLWVELARDWAALGCRVLRIDQVGVGDSDSDSDRRSSQLEGWPSSPSWIEDDRDLVTTLQSDGSPVLMVGLCLGAYDILEVALWERVDAAFLISPNLTLMPIAARGREHYTPLRRAGFPMGPLLRWRPAQWNLLARLLLKGYRWRGMYGGRYRRFGSEARVLKRIVRRGTSLAICVNANDVRQLTSNLLLRPTLRRLRRAGGFHMVVNPDMEHGLLDYESREFVRAEATHFVRDFHSNWDQNLGASDLSS